VVWIAERRFWNEHTSMSRMDETRLVMKAGDNKLNTKRSESSKEKMAKDEKLLDNTQDKVRKLKNRRRRNLIVQRRQ
jgi:hypothetical protein